MTQSSPLQAHAEVCNRELKKAVSHAMAKTNATALLLDYCTTLCSEVRNFTAHPLFNLHGRPLMNFLMARLVTFQNILATACMIQSATLIKVRHSLKIKKIGQMDGCNSPCCPSPL